MTCVGDLASKRTMITRAAAIRRAQSLPIVLLALSVSAVPAMASDWYVSPTGSSSNSGALASPWDIASALGNTGNSAGKVKPGDTVWLLGGTYRYPTRTNSQGGNSIHGYTINLTGSSASRITIRNYNNQRAVVDGGLNVAYGSSAGHLNVWGLEIVVSENLSQSRTSGQSGSSVTDLNRPAGGMEIAGGTDLHFINNIVHDNTYNGFGFWQGAQGSSELYGNIIYNNGWIGPDRYHGHGIYTQNGLPPGGTPAWDGTSKYITGNLVQGNYAKPLQAYGSSSSATSNYVINGNTFRGRADGNDIVTVLGGSAASANYTVTNNHLFYSPLDLGYSTIDNVSLTSTILDRGYVDRVGATHVTESGTVATGTSSLDFNRPLAQVYTFLQANTYEPNRATLVIFQPNSTALTQAVDFGPFLPKNALFELRNPENFFGAAVFSGRYTGSAVSVPTGAEYSSYIVQIVPEPASIGLLGGSLILLAQRWPR